MHPGIHPNSVSEHLPVSDQGELPTSKRQLDYISATKNTQSGTFHRHRLCSITTFPSP